MSRSEDFTARALETARRILDTEAQGILAQRDRLGDSFVALVRRLLDLDGHLAITGVGKSGIIGEKISATLSSTGTPSFFLKPVEALHGDLGMLRPGDLLLALSNSGETHEVLSVVHAAQALGTEIVSFTGIEDSTLARLSSIVVNTGVAAEACPLGLAPTASTTVTLAVGDALAMVLLEERGFSRENYAQFHPGGSLGQRLRYRVRDLLRSGDLLPVVGESATVREALQEMTARENLGITLVATEERKLTGVLTDGDLRRILLEGDPETVLSRPVRDVMGKNPRTIDAEASAADALQHMEKKGITALAVVDPLGRIEGVIHLHDILGRGTVVL